jgi:hypothetical protein
VALAQHGGEREIDHVILADDHLLDVGADAGGGFGDHGYLVSEVSDLLTGGVEGSTARQV